MKYVWMVGGALLIVSLLVVAIGAMLPRAHTASIARSIPAEAHRVYAAITGIPQFPEWRTGVARVEIDPAGGRYVEYGDSGELPLKILERKPPSCFVVEIDDSSLPFGGTWTFEIAPAAGGGSMVTITEDGFVGNPVFRFVSRFLLGHERNLRTYAADLERRFAVRQPGSLPGNLDE